MNLKLYLTVCLSLLLIAFTPPALADGDDDDDDSQGTFQAQNMFMAGAPPTLLPGAATLTRTDDGISYRIYTSGLLPGAHTVWFIIFNKPQNCAGSPGPCSGPDR